MRNMTSFFCFIFFIFVFIKSVTDALEPLPVSKKIDIIEGREYTFGVVENDDSTNITKCSYKSDTGIEGSFVVVKHGPPEDQLARIVFNNANLRAEPNNIANWGKIGWCQIVVKNVGDKGPKKWTVIPYDEITKKDLPAVSFTVNFFYKVPLLKDVINVQESASFLQYLKTDIKFSTCKLTFEGTDMDLPLYSTRANVFLSPYSLANERVAAKISALGQGLCGFKLINASPADALTWTLNAVNEQGNPYRAIFKSQVYVKPSDTDLHTKEEVVVGGRGYISFSCATSDEFYSIYNPQGQLIPSELISGCTYSFKTVKTEDIGVWEGYVGIDGKTMESIYYTKELVQKGSETVETWTNETENYVHIGCQIHNFTSPFISFCKITTPDKKIFNLQTGFATSRYLSIGTDLDKGVCAMQIEKPLQESEKGLWHCEMKRSSEVITGGFIKVAKDEIPDYPKHLKVTTQIGQPFTVYCEVPYSSEYCTIRAPDGTSYPTQNSHQTRLGRCSYKVDNSSAVHNGTWSCAFAREIGVPDEVITVEVTVGEVLTYYRSTEVDSGDNANLMCSSGGLPMKYCRFVSPTGAAYYIHNFQKSPKISYYGKGLENGECGITISKVQTTDSGLWTCITKIGGDKEDEVIAYMSLDVSPNLLSDTNLAAGIGIAVGVVAVSVIIGVVGIRRWRRRRHAELAGTSTAPRQINDGDNVSHNSETDIFSLGPPPRSYTNPATTTNEEQGHEHQP